MNMFKYVVEYKRGGGDFHLLSFAHCMDAARSEIMRGIAALMDREDRGDEYMGLWENANREAGDAQLGDVVDMLGEHAWRIVEDK